MISDHPALGERLLDYSLRETSHHARDRRPEAPFGGSAPGGASTRPVTEGELGPARFILPFEKRMLAARIGCSQENLSRAFATLRRVGVENSGAPSLCGIDPALRAFAVQAAPRETE